MTVDIYFLLSWLAYAASPNPKYNPLYDLNGDGYITISDLLELLTLFGTTI